MGMAKNLQIHTEPIVQASVFAVVFRKEYVGRKSQPSGGLCVHMKRKINKKISIVSIMCIFSLVALSGFFGIYEIYKRAGLEWVVIILFFWCIFFLVIKIEDQKQEIKRLERILHEQSN